MIDPRTFPGWFCRSWASLTRREWGGLPAWLVLNLGAALVLSSFVAAAGPGAARLALVPYALTFVGVFRSIRHTRRELEQVLAEARQEVSAAAAGGQGAGNRGSIGSSLQDILRDLKDARQELSKKHLDMVKIIALAMEARDAYTQGHCLRVRYLTRRMLKLLPVDGHYSEVTEAAALLHDVGKIGIPDALLLKRSKLSPEEYNRIMFHVEIGVEILQAISSLREMARFVRHHHEHFDGSGYPDGLKGENIPLASRVIAVADAIDAMRSTRPYRRRLSLEETIAELKKSRGTQFDPEVVDSALQVLAGSSSASSDRGGPVESADGSPGEPSSAGLEPAESLVAVEA